MPLEEHLPFLAQQHKSFTIHPSAHNASWRSSQDANGLTVTCTSMQQVPSSGLLESSTQHTPSILAMAFLNCVMVQIVNHVCRFARTGPTPAVMESYYVRLSQCMGLDPYRKAALNHPKLLVIDRQPEYGRSFENAAQLQKLLEDSFPAASVVLQR